MTMCWLAVYLEVSPPMPLYQSKNVTVRIFHIWPGSVHEHIFLELAGPANLEFFAQKIEANIIFKILR